MVSQVGVATFSCRPYPLTRENIMKSLTEPDVVPPRTNIRLLNGTTNVLLLLLYAVTSTTNLVLSLLC
jgi:hypothetical protein